MKVRTGGRTIELDIDERVKGGVVGTPGAASAEPLRSVNARYPVRSNPDPSPPRDGSVAYLTREIKPVFRSKLEEAYANYLHALLLAGDILQYRYEPLRFQLAPNTTITPDFQVKLKDGSYEFHETKGGFVREDAIAKLKICARLYPEWRFVMV